MPISNVVDWLSANERNLVVDSIILGELCIGILALPRGRKRTQLEQWFGDVVQTIDCLPWDALSANGGLNRGGFEAEGRQVASAGQHDRCHGAPTRPHRCHEEHAGFQKAG